MSTPRSFLTFFILGVILSHELANSVPLQKPSRNASKTISHLRPPPKRNSTQRNGRFLGKFSLTAGLGLPDPIVQAPLHHPSDRADILYDLRAPPPYVSSYNNYPGARWGPYVAAVYEPVPVFSFFENPLGYLATYLNPYNWFGVSDNGSTSTTSRPDHSTTQQPMPVKNQDVVLLVEDNEIPNDDRNSMMDKMEMKMEMEKENDNNEKLQKIMNALTIETLMKITNAVTKRIDTEDSADLIAEETTVKLIEKDKEDEDESRQVRPRPPQQHQQQQHTTHRVSTTHRAPPTTTTTTTTEAPTTIETTTPEVTTRNEDTTETTTPTEIMTSMASTTSTTSTASTTTKDTMNITTTTPIPAKNSSWYPLENSNGYYYGGYPQNVSHVEFTTPAPLTTTPAAAQFSNFNDINRVLQPFPPNYYDAFEPPSLDYHNRFNQFSADSNDYYNRDNEFLSNNDFDANGFKPSFPFLF